MKLRLTVLSVMLILKHFTTATNTQRSDQKHCLQKTRITIFVDFEEIPQILDLFVQEFSNIETIVQNILRDECYEAKLYYPLERKFIELSTDELHFHNSDWFFKTRRELKMAR